MTGVRQRSKKKKHFIVSIEFSFTFPIGWMFSYDVHIEVIRKSLCVDISDYFHPSP